MVRASRLFLSCYIYCLTHSAIIFTSSTGHSLTLLFDTRRIPTTQDQERRPGAVKSHNDGDQLQRRARYTSAKVARAEKVEP